MARELRAESPIELLVRGLDQQVIVERTQRQPKSVSVLIRADAVDARDFEPVDRALRGPRNQGFEEIVLATPEFGDRGRLARDRAHAERIGDERADHPSVAGEVRPKDCEGILLSSRGDRVDVFLFRLPILEDVALPFRRGVAVASCLVGTQPRRTLTW